MQVEKEERRNVKTNHRTRKWKTRNSRNEKVNNYKERSERANLRRQKVG